MSNQQSVIFYFAFIAPDSILSFFFFFNDTATTEIYTLSLHDALPILLPINQVNSPISGVAVSSLCRVQGDPERLRRYFRSEEHTSELQSPCNLVCRLLLEKKNKI